MIEILKQLKNFGGASIIFILILIIMLIPLVIDSWNRFLNALGLKTKHSIMQKEYQKQFNDLKSEFKRYQDEIYEKQKTYHQQSIDIRDKLRDNQIKLEKSQSVLKESIDSLTQMLQTYIKSDKERAIATLRNSLWKMHKEFMEQGYVTPDGLKTFTEMGRVYEEAGGNDIYHEKLKPEILSLEVRYQDTE